jgi:hypothetical protein
VNSTTCVHCTRMERPSNVATTTCNRTGTRKDYRNLFAFAQRVRV